MAKAQASLELLIVFLVFLSALGISLAATSKIGAAVQEKENYNLAAASFRGLSAKIESACAMGNGNIRLAEISGAKAKVSSDGKSIFFSAGSFNSSQNFSCEIASLADSPSSSFRIENKDGAIEIS